MGLYDTFVFEKPFPCPVCGASIKSVQSKSFGCLIETYRVGDAIADCGIRIGVIEESLYCDSCRGPQGDTRAPVFLVIWHGIFAGGYSSMPEAEARLSGIDRLTLLEWHDRQQEEKEDWSRRFRNLRGALSDWREYTLAEDKDAFIKRPLVLFRSGLREAVAESDPLGWILEKHGKEPAAEDDVDMFGG